MPIQEVGPPWRPAHALFSSSQGSWLPGPGTPQAGPGQLPRIPSSQSEPPGAVGKTAAALETCCSVCNSAAVQPPPGAPHQNPPYFQQHGRCTRQICRSQIRASARLKHSLRGLPKASFRWVGLPNNYAHLQCLAHSRCSLNVCCPHRVSSEQATPQHYCCIREDLSTP